MEREPEYVKDRLNQQIRDLTRDNGNLRELLYRKDREIVSLNNKLKEADNASSFMGVVLGTLVLMMLVGAITAIRVYSGETTP